MNDVDSSVPGIGLPPGTLLCEFEVVRCLGVGGFGITYLARDTTLHRDVVVKENFPSQAAAREYGTSRVVPRSSDPEDVEIFQWSLANFLREATTLARFEHPALVRILRHFEANGTAYFVMPFVSGKSLDQEHRDRHRQGRTFTEAELRTILRRILEGLRVLHGGGVFHRDLKPSNIILTESGLPILIDFGSARELRGRHTGTLVESPGYTPAELLQSNGDVGPWSDLYGLAATLYAVLLGTAPPTAWDRIGRDPILRLAEQRAGDYSPELLALLDDALAFEPRARPGSVEDWLRRLGEPAGEASPQVPPPEAPSGKVEEAKRRRVGPGPALVAAFMVCGAVAFGGWEWQRRNAREALVAAFEELKRQDAADGDRAPGEALRRWEAFLERHPRKTVPDPDLWEEARQVRARWDGQVNREATLARFGTEWREVRHLAGKRVDEPAAAARVWTAFIGDWEVHRELAPEIRSALATAETEAKACLDAAQVAALRQGFEEAKRAAAGQADPLVREKFWRRFLDSRVEERSLTTEAAQILAEAEAELERSRRAAEEDRRLRQIQEDHAQTAAAAGREANPELREAMWRSFLSRSEAAAADLPGASSLVSKAEAEVRAASREAAESATLASIREEFERAVESGTKEAVSAAERRDRWRTFLERHQRHRGLSEDVAAWLDTASSQVEHWTRVTSAERVQTAWGLAQEAFARRDFAAALEQGGAVLAEDPDHSGALSIAVRCHLGIGDFERAETSSGRFLSLFPEEPEAVGLAAVVASESKRTLERDVCRRHVQACRDALRAEAGNRAAGEGLARCLADEARLFGGSGLEEARAILRGLAGRGEEASWAVLRLDLEPDGPGRVRLARETLAVLDREIARAPDWARLHEFRAKACRESGDGDGAFEALTAAYLLRPSWGGALERSVLLAGEGKVVEALQWANRGVELARGAERAYCRWQVGRLMSRNGETIQALAVMEELVAAYPGVEPWRTERDSLAAGSRGELAKGFVREYLAAGESGSDDDQSRYYADRVYYFDGHKSRGEIEREFQAYCQEWSTRAYRVAGPLNAEPVGGDVWRVSGKLQYEVSNEFVESNGLLEKEYDVSFEGGRPKLVRAVTAATLSTRHEVTPAARTYFGAYAELFAATDNVTEVGGLRHIDLYDDPVYYYDKTMSREAIWRDQQSYDAKWPLQAWKVLAAPEVSYLGASKGFQLGIDLAFANSADGVSVRRGTARVILRVRRDARGFYRIYHEDNTN